MYVHVEDQGKDGFRLATSDEPRADCKWTYLDVQAHDKSSAITLATEYANANGDKICPICCKIHPWDK